MIFFLPVSMQLAIMYWGHTGAKKSIFTVCLNSNIFLFGKSGNFSLQRRFFFSQCYIIQIESPSLLFPHLFFLISFYFWKAEWQERRQRERKRKRKLLSTGFLPFPLMTTTGKTASGWTQMAGYHPWVVGTQVFVLSSALPRHISGELDQKQHSWD